MSAFLAGALRPFLFLLFAVFAWLLASLLHKAIPEGKVKRLLYNKDLQRRHPWKFAILAILASWAALVFFGWLAITIHNA